MTLQPGYRLAVAPGFHLDLESASRLGIGAGVERTDDGFFPRGPWRPPTRDELAQLVIATEVAPLTVLGRAPSPQAPTPDAVLLFQLPGHLRGAWWELLDAAAESGGPLEGFDGFAARVSEFLEFKRLAAPGSSQMEAVVTAPGERSIRRNPETGRPSGLGSTVAPWSPWPADSRSPAPRLHAVVNLGDEPTGVVLVTLPPSGMVNELTKCRPAEPEPRTVGELVERFLLACPNYPLVRLTLGAGEGCRLPAAGLILDGDPTGKDDPDVVLLVSAGG